jgi:hypothetical protein
MRLYFGSALIVAIIMVSKMWFIPLMVEILPEYEKIVEEVFLRGDLVKFAKILPNQELMERDFLEIYEFVERSVTDIEAEHLREVH